MDGTRFDDLAKRIALARITRVAAVRGLAGSALAALAGAAVLDDETEARKKKQKRQRNKKRDAKQKQRDKQRAQKEKKGKNDGTASAGGQGGTGQSRTNGAQAEGKKGKKKRRICHCPDGNPANCKSLRVKKKARKKHLKNHQFDYKGRCQTVACTNNSECAPQVCVNGFCQPCTRDNQCDAPQICNVASGNCQTAPPGPGTTTTAEQTTTTAAATTTTAEQTTTTAEQTTTTAEQTTTTAEQTTTTAEQTTTTAEQTTTTTCSPDPSVCDGRVCGTATDVCGVVHTCGANEGDCPPAAECNSAGVCGADGQCTYTIDDAQVGTPCGENTGVCVKNGDDTGTCLTSNNGTITCNDANACVGGPPCGATNGYGEGDCACYATVEAAGLCVRRVNSGPNAFKYPNSAVACTDLDTRPACDVSADCPDGSVCVPLNADPVFDGICCPDRGGATTGIGQCVQVATDLCAATP